MGRTMSENDVQKNRAMLHCILHGDEEQHTRPPNWEPRRCDWPLARESRQEVMALPPAFDPRDCL